MPTIHVTTKSGKSQNALWREGNALVAHIQELPRDGEANAYLESYLALKFGISPSRVTITKGRTNQYKTVVFLQDDRIFQMKLIELPELPQQSLFI